MSSIEKRGGTNSSTPSFFDICSFSARTSRKAASSKDWRCAKTLESRCPISSAVRPRMASDSRLTAVVLERRPRRAGA